MAHLNEISSIKTRLSQHFLSDKALMSLLTRDDRVDVPAMDLMYKQVFPYDWIDGTTTQETSFLCYDVDVPGIINPAAKHVTIWVWVICHKNVMQTSQGVRRDRIAARVDELVNGSSAISGLGEIELVSVQRRRVLDDFYCRELQYKAKDYNRIGESI